MAETRTLRTVEDLAAAGLVALARQLELAQVAARYAVAITPAMATLIEPDDEAQARQIVAALGPQAGFYKIGLQLLTAEGPALARELVAGGQEVFLDLKLHEI
eukprot:gene10428-14005_t